ncbi:unannotated protein [freshwater metagenome]|uniref:Unannotated protein n=1 Tax=freshwater metagenome TaxID=449393 RepID=A0A6J7DR51_9ZZZZ
MIEPVSTALRPAMVLSKVDLPAPFGPSIAITLPGSNSALNFRVNSPRCEVKLAVTLMRNPA